MGANGKENMWREKLECSEKESNVEVWNTTK